MFSDIKTISLTGGFDSEMPYGDLYSGTETKNDAGTIGTIVLGSAHVLGGKFKDVVADYAIKTLAALPCKFRIFRRADSNRQRSIWANNAYQSPYEFTRE